MAPPLATVRLLRLRGLPGSKSAEFSLGCAVRLGDETVDAALADGSTELGPNCQGDCRSRQQKQETIADGDRTRWRTE